MRGNHIRRVAKRTIDTMQVEMKPAPVLKMLGVSAAVAFIIVLIYRILESLPHADALLSTSPWLLAHLVHIPQFVLPFLLILHITHGQPSTYGFNLNEDAHLTHRRMLAVGVGFGLIMSLKYIPQVIRTGSVEIPLPATAASIAGHMTFQWIVVGLSEETMFRGLIQTYLMKNLEGHVRLLGRSLHMGTVIAAVFWGAFHFLNILIMPLGPVVFYVILTTAIGLIMGYAYEKTGSLLTTIIVHNTIFGVPLTIGYILYWVL